MEVNNSKSPQNCLENGSAVIPASHRPSPATISRPLNLYGAKLGHGVGRTGARAFRGGGKGKKCAAKPRSLIFGNAGALPVIEDCAILPNSHLGVGASETNAGTHELTWRYDRDSPERNGNPAIRGMLRGRAGGGSQKCKSGNRETQKGLYHAPALAQLNRASRDRYANSLSGFSISGFIICMKLAASQPSTTR